VLPSSLGYENYTDSTSPLGTNRLWEEWKQVHGVTYMTIKLGQDLCVRQQEARDWIKKMS